jgi:dTDP-4-dehydrorhamnose 3,5-epimerase
VLLSAENNKQLMVPHGFAHGFVLSAISDFKVDQVYNKESERIRYDDPTLAIDWQLDPNEVIVSDKDSILP